MLTETTITQKKVAITGATGFVGQYLVRALCRKNQYCCRLLVRNIELANQMFSDVKDKVEIVYADISVPESLTDCFNGCDIVVHLAALVTHSAALEDALTINRDGTKNLITEAYKAGVSKFIHTSSTAAIGELKGHITEETECKPVMSYQIAKYESEQVCLKAFADNKFPVLIIRPSMIYGEGTKQDLYTISKIVKMFHVYPIVGKSENYSPALYVTDMVQAVILLIESGKVGEIYNVSSEESYSIKRKVSIIADTLGIKVWMPHIPAGLLIVAFKVINFCLKVFNMQLDMQPQNIINSGNDRFFDITKLQKLGFKQKVSIEDGVERAVKDFINRGLL